MSERKWGWRKDPLDKRDYIRPTIKLAMLPDVVDLSHWLPDVRDQGQLGSCVGFGVAGNLTGTAKQRKCYTEWFSPTWVYNGARRAQGWLDEDSGAYPRDAFEFLRDYGCLLEHFRPYHDTLDTTDPTTWECAPEALKWPIVSYTRLVDGIDGICTALAGGSFVSIGAPWYGTWLDPESDGVLVEEYRPGDIAGGHEFLTYGYDKNLTFPGKWWCQGGLLAQNSWGESWGKKGRFYIPWTAPNNWKLDGGYDAHVVNVEWAEVPIPEKHKRWLRLQYSNTYKETWKNILTVPLP